MISLLKELPPPPTGKTGWPWTKESKLLPLTMKDGKPWPRISIVTPSYNQAQFLEETIRSVLLQNYPNIEYIIMDGESTDNSKEIIKKYKPWLSYWVSEKDEGQADAINRGFEKTTGQILGWLNSDDLYLQDAFMRVGKRFSDSPNIELIIGGGIFIDAEGNFVDKCYSFPQTFDSLLLLGQFFLQMSAFWLRNVYFEVGTLDTTLRFCFDYDFFLKLTRRKQPDSIDSSISAVRLHPKSKTSTIFKTVALPEADLVRKRYGFNLLSDSEKVEKRKYFDRQYHLNRRRGILKDIVFDPAFFLKQFKNKLV
jgi:glycosyltransferase involved in cell wall biosynthesis